MSTEKAKSRKAKSSAAWWVLQKMHDDLFSLVYRGPDRTAARRKAEAVLVKDAKAQLLTGKMGRQSVLGAEHLQAQLPKDAF